MISAFTKIIAVTIGIGTAAIIATGTETRIAGGIETDGTGGTTASMRMTAIDGEGL